MKTDLTKQAGFTLIELLVVIAIVGLIGTIIITALANARLKGRDSKRKQDIVQLAKALELYYNTNNSYPNTGSAFWSSSTGGCSSVVKGFTGAGGYIPDLAPTFIGVLPADPKPSNGVCSGYAYKSDGASYKILSNSVSGLGGPETFPAAGEPFYDAVRPGTAWMICLGGATPCGW